MTVEIRDLACFGRPARLVWRKRRWRCVDVHCDARTWTEASVEVSSRSVLTIRAGVEACRQVGMNARPVAGLARELGVCWWTVMEAVIEHGTALVDDPARVGPVDNLGVDETSLLKANRRHATIYATGLVDLNAGIIIDMVEGNARCGHGFKRCEHYRLRVLLHAGGVAWPTRPCAPRIRTRTPHSDA